MAVVARGQPCLIVGDLKIEPAKTPCLLKGIVAGFWVDLQEAWATASGSVAGAACKHSCNSSSGTIGTLCPLAANALNNWCNVLADRWVFPHYAVRASFLLRCVVDWRMPVYSVHSSLAHFPGWCFWTCLVSQGPLRSVTIGKFMMSISWRFLRFAGWHLGCLGCWWYFCWLESLVARC